MTIKHTPGPWAIGRSNGNLRTVICLDAKQPIGTALAFTVSRNGRGFDQCEIDACLIAAAPELLEALKQAKEHLEYCGYGDNYERECAKEKGLPELIERVLVKAEGK